jgi:hypothetical protein
MGPTVRVRLAPGEGTSHPTGVAVACHRRGETLTACLWAEALFAPSDTGTPTAYPKATPLRLAAAGPARHRRKTLVNCLFVHLRPSARRCRAPLRWPDAPAAGPPERQSGRRSGGLARAAVYNCVYMSGGKARKMIFRACDLRF